MITRRTLLQGLALGAAAAGLPAARAQGNERVAAIDIHAHMPLAKFGGPLAGRFASVPAGADDAAAALARAVQGDSLEVVAQSRLNDMDAWGVSRSVIMPIDFGMGSENDRHWEEMEAIAAVARLHPDRFIPFFACDPRRADALTLLERAANELGMRGVKIHPLAGFAVDDREVCYPFFEKCVDLKLPILGHCRPLGAAARDDLCRPERYANVAKDFPSLKVCLGHFGGGAWTDDVLAVIETHSNAYADVSTMQGFAMEDPDRFLSYVARAVTGPAKARLMYGSDWPTQRPMDLAFLTKLRAGISEESPLAADAIARLLSENAEAFLSNA